MREGHRATYGGIQHRTLGHTRVTFECEQHRRIVNNVGHPVRQWLFRVEYDSEHIGDETSVENYLYVGISDQTQTRLREPDYDPPGMEDWDTCFGVLIKQTEYVETEELEDANGLYGPFRREDTIADYSTERACITGAMLRVLEDAYMLNPEVPRCPEMGCHNVAPAFDEQCSECLPEEQEAEV